METVNVLATAADNMYARPRGLGNSCTINFHICHTVTDAMEIENILLK
jgi:hypothetical protein